jgi:hypothetical protein
MWTHLGHAFHIPEQEKNAICLETFNLWVIGERMHHDTPANFGHAVWDVLSNTYNDWWIGWDGLTAWPLCSKSHLNPQNCYLSGHLQTLCVCNPCWQWRYSTIVLWKSVRVSAAAPASINRCGSPWWDVPRCALNLMEGILTTCYKRISFITHKRNISGHDEMDFSFVWGGGGYRTQA